MKQPIFSVFLISVIGFSHIVNSAYYQFDPTLVNPQAMSFDTVNPYSCLCDITYNSCDVYCCCDPDCSASAVASFSSSGNCVVNQVGSQFCSVSNNAFALKYVASRRGVSSVFFSNATDSGVCVQVSGAVQDFSKRSILTNTDLSLTAAQNIITAATTRTKAANPVLNATSYLAGYNIISSSGFITIPVPGSFGECEDNYRIKFGYNEPSRTCTRRRVIDATNCASNGIFSALSYNSLSYYSTPSIGAGNQAIFYSLTNIDSTTGTSTTTSFPSNTALNPIFSSSGSTCTCANAISSIDYYYVTSTTSITNVYIAVTTKTISGTCSVKSSLSQAFSVNFVSNLNQLSSNTEILGNPGYLIGKNLKIGVSTTVGGSNAIQINNIPYPVNGIGNTGNCLFNSAVTSSVSKYDIKFGNSFSTNCIQSVTDLSQFCSSTGLSNWNNLGIFNNIIAGTTYFGQFGTADVNYIRDFILAQGTAISSSLITYNSTLGVCSFYTTSNVRIYYTSAGYQEQYQYYIAKVNVDFTDSLTIYSGQLPKSIPFELNIEFVEIDTVLYPYRKLPRSPITPKLPDDLFYPIFSALNDSPIIKFHILLFVSILIVILL